MDRSIEYPAWGDGPDANKTSLTRRRRWMRETPVVTDTEGPKIAFRLLLCSSVVLYSNVADIHKQLDISAGAHYCCVGALHDAY
jgi:hypothetical protein